MTSWKQHSLPKIRRNWGKKIAVKCFFVCVITLTMASSITQVMKTRNIGGRDPIRHSAQELHKVMAFHREPPKATLLRLLRLQLHQFRPASQLPLSVAVVTVVDHSPPSPYPSSPVSSLSKQQQPAWATASAAQGNCTGSSRGIRAPITKAPIAQTRSSASTIVRASTESSVLATHWPARNLLLLRYNSSLLLKFNYEIKKKK